MDERVDAEPASGFGKVISITVGDPAMHDLMPYDGDSDCQDRGDDLINL
jgi:hypothetical protein